MQARKPKVYEMKRDMDLVRDLLMYIENDPTFDGQSWQNLELPDEMYDKHRTEEIAYHVGLLIEAGFIRGQLGATAPTISKLTWNGHEFLDNIKDRDIWHKAKQRIKGLPGVALTVVAEIAKEEIRKKLGL